jgi:hypothetical protein
MRTTIDLPESLLRRAKAAAALEGKTLKTFLTEAVAQALSRRPESGRTRKRASLPLVRSRSPGTRAISADTLSDALQAEDLDALARR